MKKLYIARLEDYGDNIIMGIVAKNYKDAKRCALTFSDELGGDDLSWWELRKYFRMSQKKDIDVSDLEYGPVDGKIGVERGIYYCEL